ncbi:hypothetical protein D3C80_1607760 [compost metagenome]
MLEVAVIEHPVDFLVSQLNLLQVIVLCFSGVFYVVHDRLDIHYLDVFKHNAVVLFLITCAIDAVPLELDIFQGLPFGHSLVQVDRGRIDFLGKQKWGVNPSASQLARIVICGN